jgi:integrase
MLLRNLSAAFNHAVKVTNDPLKQDKIFNVQLNPVLNIPKQTQFEKTQDRSLSIEEVKHLLAYIDKTKGVSVIVAQAIKFLFYIGGQRPLQVLREGWSSYDYRRKTLLITDTKGRGSKREYLTPLTPRAFSILDLLYTQDMPYPFTTNGESAIRVETLLTAVQKYCKKYDVEKFTLRDIRRTCKNLMIDAGVNRETRNLIQNHGLTGIDFKHYDKHDHLPEKMAGMSKYDRFLNSLLNDDTSNVIQLVTK